MVDCKESKPICTHRLCSSVKTLIYTSDVWLLRKLKRVTVLSVLATLLVSCVTGAEASLDPIVHRAKETSLYAEQVDWLEIDSGFRRLVGSRQTVEDLKPGLEYLINSLGDKHGTVRSASDYSVVAWFTGESDSLDVPWDSDFLETVIHDTSAEFEYSLIHDDIGYLKIVGIGPGDVDEQARLIRDGLRRLKDQGIERWIVDLRYNGGGNMNPMMAGLAPLIGEGFIGGSVDSQKALVHRYEITGSNFFDSGRQVCNLKDGPNIGSKEKVAVLLSRYTISSGELVATALKERDNTLFIGERTAGYTTGTGYEDIGQGLIMTISESVFVDRNMTEHPHGVVPDVESEFVPEIDSESKSKP